MVIGTLNKLVVEAKCALADLEGVMPEFEPSGDREHPGWKTILNLRKVLKRVERNQAYIVLFDGDEYSEPEAEIYEGKRGLTDEQVIEETIKQACRDGVVYTVDEAVKVIPIDF